MADVRTWSAERVDALAPGEEIERFWRQAAERRGNAFATPEWQRAAWSVEPWAEPMPIVVRDGEGSLRGVLTFTRDAEGLIRFGNGSRADRQELACDPADEGEVARAAAAALDVLPSRGFVELANVDADTGDEHGWAASLAGALPGRHLLRAWPATGLPYLDCASHGDWDAYLASRSSSFRKRLRQLDRRMEKDAATLARTEDAAALPDDLGAFFDLHDRRWSKRGGSTIAPDHRDLLRRFADGALERGWLRLWTLRAGGAAVASWLGWRIGDRYAFYNAGFDPDWASRSPGMYVLARVIEDAFAEGVAEFDFLLGEEAYKSRFADSSRSIATVVIVGARRPARAVVAAEFAARRLARRLPDRVREGGPMRTLRRLVSRG